MKVIKILSINLILLFLLSLNSYAWSLDLDANFMFYESNAIIGEQVKRELGAINIEDETTGDYIEHTCVYVRKYDIMYHWEECVVCGKIKEKEAHHIMQRGGVEDIYGNHVNVCDSKQSNVEEYCVDGCGYYIKLAKPSCTNVWIGHKVYEQRYHNVNCVCMGHGDIGNREVPLSAYKYDSKVR